MRRRWTVIPSPRIGLGQVFDEQRYRPCNFFAHEQKSPEQEHNMWAETDMNYRP
jgi:hypothetical protein